MQVLKKYFLTVNALLALLLVLAASHLQGNLAYLMQFPHGERIIRLIGKIDQLSLILVAGIALAIAAIYLIVYQHEKFNGPFFVLLALFALTIFFKGKFENLGVDSVAEIFSSNSQEAADYAVSHLFRINLSLKESLVLLAPFALVPVYMAVAKGLHSAAKARDIRFAFFVVAGIYGIVVFSFCSKLTQSYQSIDSYRMPLRQSTLAALPLFSAAREAPNVVVYIGESTIREGFGPYRASGSESDALNGLGDNLIAFTNVITAFSHTFPSLYRTFTVANDPYEDQFMLIRDLRRANALAVMGASGVETHWLSNQNRGCRLDWTSQLFGEQAARVEFMNLADDAACLDKRGSDTDLLKLYGQHAAHLDRPRQAIFLHSYAGHDDYCLNIPEGERRHAGGALDGLPQKALFGDKYISNIERHRQAINCYESAISYVAKNVRSVVDSVAQQTRPTVLIYFSDHGEDPFAGTGHDSRYNSFRHIEIPFLVYFNQAAMERFPDLYQAARDNRHKRYSLEWFSDSLLDVLGISYAKRPLVSVFRKDLSPPPRYALRKSDLSGNDLILAIDDEDASSRHGLLNHGHDYYRKRRLTHAVTPAQSKRLCSSHANSLLKFREASEIFHCLEVDVMIDAESGKLMAYRPPKKSNQLDLEALTRAGFRDTHRLYLSVHNLNSANFEIFLTRLNAIIPQWQRARIMVKTGLFDGAEPAQMRRIADAGYKLFYELPSYQSRRCAQSGTSSACQRFAEEVAARIEMFRFDGLALERDAFPFVAALSLNGMTELSISDASVKAREDLHIAALHRSSAYLIPYRSDFDY